MAYPETAIVADGKFPDHPVPVGYLLNAKRVVCCDGAADSVVEFGLEPFAIVGDCDSLHKKIADKYSDRLYRIEEQENNDLTKAVHWCHDRGYNSIVILGATGKREDHTLGNISLLAEYAKLLSVRMITDSGILVPVLKKSRIESVKGQQVSIFSIDPETSITSESLKYPLKEMKLKNWWQATLNEAEGPFFELDFQGGPLIVYLKFID
jgi:thiamine pyrophosphokinase